jgi:hypothetical protein
MPKTRKSLHERYPHKMDEETRRNIYASLKWQRACLAGLVKGPYGWYDPSLGDRRKSLRRDCAKAVIRLALGRYKAW